MPYLKFESHELDYVLSALIECYHKSWNIFRRRKLRVVINDFYKYIYEWEHEDLYPARKRRIKMDVKKYVELENGYLIITSNKGYFRFQGKKLCTSSGGSLGTIVKESDDLVDFVKEGDLLEFNKGEVVVVTNVTDTHINEHPKAYVTLNGFAIYKKDWNGDYKKYGIN